MNNPNSEQIEIVYDDQCPVCRLYCKDLSPDQPDADFTLTDARKASTIMDRVNARGLDIDQGMVVTVGDEFYYGSDAMYQIARRSRRTGWTGLMNRIFFSTPRRAAVFYPLGKAARNFILRLRGIKPVHNLKPRNTLKHQLGDDWQKLDANIQARFDREPDDGEVILYTGIMNEIRRSRMGWLFACLTRVIGNPLTRFAGTDIPVEVSLYKKPGENGVFWQRRYLFPDKAPEIVVSAKQESKSGQMLECVGGGFGMKLKVSAQNAALHFTSTRYFCSLLQYRIPLPHWITPGTAHVSHTDLGDGRFRFEISIRHHILGETFFQSGIFQRQAA